ncbi:MAG: DUF104 domain-containing protein [Chloroflexi bacterium]|nr:DUF104 domain-containing protein [Chloroflexota bacterium]MYE31631.1 DUF104 domain-containing protein [Chloroflexota bacterium]
MTTTLKARYAGGVFTPLEPVDLEEGKEVTMSIDEASAADGALVSESQDESLLDMFDRLRKSVPPDAWDDMPADLVRNKKHYLYGHPRED